MSFHMTKAVGAKDSLKSRAVAASLLFASAPVLAHHPMGGMTPETFGQGLLSGIGHPVIGLDHLAFLLIAALLTCSLQGRERFTVPLAFIAATVGGTLLHLGAATIPMAEALVAVSVMIGAVLLLARHSVHALGLAALFAVSGVLHGYAYGEAVIGAEPTPVMAYLLGFAVIQYGLIVAGALAFEALTSRSQAVRRLTLRLGGIGGLLIGGLFFGLGLA